jgi:peptide/nickel transport system substrate-binding protein
MKPARSRWGLMAMTAVIVVSMVVPACGPTPTPQVPAETAPVGLTPAPTSAPTVEPTPVVEQKLRIGLPQVGETLDATQGTHYSWIVEYLIYDPLVRMGGGGNPVPCLAESWELIEPTVWQFKLREGVTFTNGEAFDAEAVKFTLDYLTDPDHPLDYGKRFLTNYKECQIVDKNTVNIVTNSPSATLVVDLIGAFMRPPKYLAEVGAEGFAEAPVGTGPFKLVEFKPDERMVVERNEDYWGPAPLLETVEFLEMPESSTRMAALQAGEIDLAEDIPVDQVQRLQDEGLEIEGVVTCRGLGVVLSTPKQREEYPFLTDKRVRQALNYAVNKEELVNTLTAGYGRPGTGQFVGPDGFGYDPNFVGYVYDPDKARQLLAEAGYPGGFTFTMYYPIRRYPYGDVLMETLPSYLAQVGVQLELEPMENAAWQERYLANDLPTTLTGPNYDPTMDADRILGMCHSSFPRQWVEPDPQMDALIDKERSALDRDERLKALQEAGAYCADLAPMLYLIFPPSFYGYSPRVHDVGFRSDQNLDLNIAHIE